MRRLAWVTTASARGYDDDEPLVLAALQRLGVEVDVVDWSDPAAIWSSYDRVVLRSTWDYTERPAEFRRWLHAVHEVTDLQNALDIVEWSMDKHYLSQLGDAGVPITPSSFLEPGQRLGEFTEPIFLKPAIGSGSRSVSGYNPDQAALAEAHVRELHNRGLGVVVQPLLTSVECEGEWALIYIDGTYSHAIGKRVELPTPGTETGLFADEVIEAHTAEDAQRAVADSAMREVGLLFGKPLYARVDLVRDNSGRMCVLELEMVEPSLFLTKAHPAAESRLAAALTAS